MKKIAKQLEKPRRHVLIFMPFKRLLQFPLQVIKTKPRRKAKALHQITRFSVSLFQAVKKRGQGTNVGARVKVFVLKVPFAK